MSFKLKATIFCLSIILNQSCQKSQEVAFNGEGQLAKPVTRLPRVPLPNAPSGVVLPQPLPPPAIEIEPLPLPAPATPGPIVQELPAPAPSAPQTPAPQAVPAASNGEVGFGVYGILNMATNHQITNDGFKVQVRDTQNNVLVTGDLGIAAIVDGEPIDFDPNNDVLARPIYLRVLQPSYISPKLASMQGVQKATVSVCLPANSSAPASDVIQCQNLNSKIGHANGVNTLDSLQADVDFQAGNKVVVKKFYNIPRRAGDYCTAKNGLPCVALGHPALTGFAISAGAAGNDLNSPLVLDLNKDGQANLIDVWKDDIKVHFDLTASGHKTRTGWVAPSDGLLAYDRNRNGKIDNGSELFGEVSYALFNKSERFEHGYAALAQHDHNKDGVINKKDKIFSKLLVWQDLNSDGVSQRHELKSLKSIQVVELALDFKRMEEDKINVASNKVYLKSKYLTKNMEVLQSFDVWFATRPYENAVLSQSK